MLWSDWLELAVFVTLLALLTRPLGAYIERVLDPGGATPLDRVMKPIERALYRGLGVNPADDQDWKTYASSLIVFSAAGFFLTYAILRCQGFLPLNPGGFAGVAPDLAFNTAASFMTNTNWQNYGGESTLSYFSQMVGLTFHNFVSAAVGIAVAAAVMRGLARERASGVGNFWVDMVRANLYLLLPLCLVYALFLVSQGMIDNFSPYVTATGLEGGTKQIIAQGPVASQVAIKMLGTNGGGFMNANAAHPFENPTPLSNFIQILSIFAIPSALTHTLGRMVKHRRHGWSIWFAMLVLFLAGALLAGTAETHGNPRIAALGVDTAQGNMEGKEARFGSFDSAFFATVTTDASCGAVNAMHDSFTPLGGLVTLFNMNLGEVVFGGVGAGLYGIVLFVVLTIFLAGLMVGRTPEILGKRIEAFEVKVSALAILVPSVVLLGLTALSATSSWGTSALTNEGPHGLGEIFYAFTSTINNNGSAFAGLSANTPVYNTLLALAMLLGRFFVIIPALALAGSFAAKKTAGMSAGSFPVSGPTFVLLLVGTVVVVGALTFLPALSLAPVVEHFLMTGSGRLF